MGHSPKLDHDRETLLKRISEMESHLGDLNEELTRTNRLATLGVLAGMIAHEFNNIITPVMSYAQLALQAPDDQALVTKALTRAVEGTEQLARIATAILGFMREDDELQSASVDCVIDETLHCLAREPGKFGITLIRDVPTGLRVGMRPICLQQVFLNLFINAIKAMSGGSGQLRVQGEMAGPGRVRILIRDTGCGMTPEIAAHIFEPLVTFPTDDQASSDGRSELDPLSIRSDPGNGLGLAVCDRLVREVGGTISVHSIVNEGTTFTIELPLSTDSEADSDQQHRRSA